MFHLELQMREFVASAEAAIGQALFDRLRDGEETGRE
jgi:hypothetical protein